MTRAPKRPEASTSDVDRVGVDLARGLLQRCSGCGEAGPRPASRRQNVDVRRVGFLEGRCDSEPGAIPARRDSCSAVPEPDTIDVGAVRPDNSLDRQVEIELDRLAHGCNHPRWAPRSTNRSS